MPETETQLATPAEAVTVVSPILELVTGAGLKGERAVAVASVFESFEQQAEQWLTDAKKINVTDITQVADMKLARESRLKLKHIRGLVEKKRVDLKADINTRGNAIQAAANHLRDIFKDMESHLQESEDFEKRYLADLRATQLVARTEEVMQLGGNPQMFNLPAMNDEQFAECIQGLKDQAAAKAQREADEKAAADKAEADRNERLRVAEAERIAAEKEAEVEKKRIADENERLKAEAAERDAESARIRQEFEASQKEAEALRVKEKEERDAAFAKEEQERKAIAKAERETREALEAAERKQHELIAGRQEALADFGKVVGFTQLSKLSDDDYAALLEEAEETHTTKALAEAEAKLARQKELDDANAAATEVARLKAEQEERERLAAAKERERLTAEIDDAAKVDADEIEAHAIEWAKQNPDVEDGAVAYIAAVITYLETAAQIA